MAKKKAKKREKELVDIDDQNQQLGRAENTKDRRRRKKWTHEDRGSAQELPGKKFDEWVWNSPDGETISIPVRVVKEKKRRAADANTLRTYFQVVMPEFAINETETDIESLRQNVFKALEVPFAIDWEPFLLVRVSGRDHPVKRKHWKAWGLREPSKQQDRHRHWDEELLDGALETEIHVEEWELGQTANGRKVSRPVREPHTWAEPSIRKEWPKILKEEEDWDGYTNCVMLPNTEDNRTALLELIRQLSAFREQLDALLNPKTVEANFKLAVQRMAKALPKPRRKKKDG